MLCSIAYIRLVISFSSYFNFMLFAFSFVICFANPLVRLGLHSSCIIRLAFIEKTKKIQKYCSLVWYFETAIRLILILRKCESLRAIKVPAKASLWTLTFIFYWADFGTSQDKHGTLEWILKKDLLFKRGITQWIPVVGLVSNEPPTVFTKVRTSYLLKSSVLVFFVSSGIIERQLKLTCY